MNGMTEWPPVNPLGSGHIINVAPDQLGALLTANPEIGVAAAIAAAVDDHDLELTGEFIVQLAADELAASAAVVAGFLLSGELGRRYTPDAPGASAYRAEVYPPVEGMDTAGPPWLRIAHETVASYIAYAAADRAAATFTRLAKGHPDDARVAVAYLLALAICSSGWSPDEANVVFWALADMVRRGG